MTNEENPIVDIFIRTYSGDLKWLSYCLKSIYKYCTGFRDIIIVIPEKQIRLLDGFNFTKEKVFTCPEYGNDYMGQQITKINANLYSNAPLILFTDSDTLFVRDTSPVNFMLNEKPVILKTRYEKVGDGIIWKKITEKALGYGIDFEFMRRLPFLYHSSTLTNFRKYIYDKHGSDISTYIQKQPNREFSEFNAIGAFADKFEQEKYYFMDTDTNELPVLHVKQFWSWGGISNEIMSEIEKILN